MDASQTNALIAASAGATGLFLNRLFDSVFGRGKRRRDDATQIRGELRADLASAREQIGELRGALADALNALAALRREYDTLHAEFEALKFKYGLTITLDPNAPARPADTPRRLS